jgi:hypothetical protein
MIKNMINKKIFLLTLVLANLLVLGNGYAKNASKEAVLQGNIQIQLIQPMPGDQTGKIQPGTPIKHIVNVVNFGQHASPTGKLYIRYAFAKPLDGEKTSVIFQSETKELPVIEPGQNFEMAFDTPHHTPSLTDFIRYDWPKREYQAIFVTPEGEHVIGTLVMTFSAHYYPVMQKEVEAKITLLN